MGQHKQRLGRAGEEVAAEYLSGIGHRILARNWRTSTGELDLISVAGEQLIAVEVKTRTSDKFGTAFEAINAAKFRRIHRLIRQWARENNLMTMQVRVDVLCIYKENVGWRIEHHRQVGS
ncbi:YraN family protein [Glutamicibacter sp. MNS18]|uniref:YraN family protein n=1 Tax=Glutamicibacter sp. MNS18 TaxID=2989817 RepID=UPI002235B54D|nr:YraN family protein [Glutamicibacter sp. MNS18]MCW4466254.1 YraN family protein [Glutamicibacter sp. MNS18]